VCRISAPLPVASSVSTLSLDLFPILLESDVNKPGCWPLTAETSGCGVFAGENTDCGEFTSDEFTSDEETDRAPS